MINIMVDLETLGTVPGCAILSIGACRFHLTEDYEIQITDDFYQVINTESCLDNFLHRDEDTLAWWQKQSPEARKVLAEAGSWETSVSLEEGLSNFAQYLKAFPGNVHVWGNGADFDNAILAVAYHVIGHKQPWEPFNGRCYRTLKNLAPNVDKPLREGTHHNALADARFQAYHACLIIGENRAKEGEDD